MKPIYTQAFAACFLTTGLVVCIAALAAGQADDAPGLGLIGIGAFFALAFAAFRCAGLKGPE